MTQFYCDICDCGFLLTEVSYVLYKMYKWEFGFSPQGAQSF